LKENKHCILSQSLLDEIVRKQTVGDKKTGNEAGEEGKMDGEEILVDGLKPPKPKFLAASLPIRDSRFAKYGLKPPNQNSLLRHCL